MHPEATQPSENELMRHARLPSSPPAPLPAGGESIYGQPFEDEFHSRLRFTRRGLVAMASSGPNSNRSQFFITFDRCDELTRKHTIFGKVSVRECTQGAGARRRTRSAHARSPQPRPPLPLLRAARCLGRHAGQITGTTVYNLNRIEEVDVDKDERPVFPPKILSAQVLSSPFDDIAPRASASLAAAAAEKARATAAAAAAAEKAKGGAKATRSVSRAHSAVVVVVPAVVVARSPCGRP